MRHGNRALDSLRPAHSVNRQWVFCTHLTWSQTSARSLVLDRKQQQSLLHPQPIYLHRTDVGLHIHEQRFQQHAWDQDQCLGTPIQHVDAHQCSYWWWTRDEQDQHQHLGFGRNQMPTVDYQYSWWSWPESLVIHREILQSLRFQSSRHKCGLHRPLRKRPSPSCHLANAQLHRRNQPLQERPTHEQ